MDADVVVIGSGPGGLTAGLALARAGEKVLVLEQHDTPGGWCHSFELGGYQFSPGVHYLGELGPGGRARAVYEGLGVARHLTFLELNPDGFEHCLVGGERFDIPRGKDQLVERLVARFPHEKEGIWAYFRAIGLVDHELVHELRRRDASKLTLPWRARHLVRYGLRSLDSVQSSFFRDPRLKAILSIQSGDHGLGPRDVPAAVHFSVQRHYFDGAWYPMGGGRSLPRAYLRELKEHGGRIQLKARVSRILTEPDRAGGFRAVGVGLEDGTEIRARRVISNADPAVTFGRLLPRERLSARTLSRVDAAKWSVSALSLFLAVDADAEALGCDSGNWWYSASDDVQAGYDVASLDRFDAAEFPGQFLTITTLKDRSKRHGRVHTCESFVFVSWDMFARWAATRYGDRPESYAQMKEDLSQKMLRGIERIVPGLTERVVFRDLGTPLSNWHYCMGTRGNLYGTEKNLRQVGPWSWPLRTEIAGLSMCGSSTVSHGVFGATMSGLLAAASALRVPAESLLTGSGEAAFLPADRVEAWPAELRARVARRSADGAEIAAK